MRYLFFILTSAIVSIDANAQWTTSGTSIYNSNSGNVGIGLTNPAAKLEILDNSNFIRLRDGQATTKTPLDFSLLGYQGVTGAMNFSFRIGYPHGAGVNSGARIDMLKILNGNTLLATDENNASLGMVGIGTSSPAALLHVAGNIQIGNPAASTAGSYQISMPGGSTTINGGNGRDLVVTAGSSDNSAGLRGGHLFLRPGVPTAPATNYGHILLADNGGNVGIGTSSPQWRLDVNGQIAARGQAVVDANATEVIIGDLSGGDGYRDLLHFYTHDTKQMTITGSGNVGIGTSSPDAKLAVKGTIHTQEVKVDMLGSMVPDYVFESNYALPSLESIKTYIDQNKHLPEVPSAKEMEANGVNLGEMNMLLLKKIEELTLYVIELKAGNEKQKKEKSELEKRMSILEELAGKKGKE